MRYGRQATAVGILGNRIYKRANIFGPHLTQDVLSPQSSCGTIGLRYHLTSPVISSDVSRWVQTTLQVDQQSKMDAPLRVRASCATGRA